MFIYIHNYIYIQDRRRAIAKQVLANLVNDIEHTFFIEEIDNLKLISTYIRYIFIYQISI